jgi:Zn-dependent protease with chaperone function
VDFYSRQAAARRQTRALVLGFILSIAAVVFGLDLVLFTLLASAEANGPALTPLEFAVHNPVVAVFCTALVLAVIGLSSIFKAMQLRQGGGVVARGLGGVLAERDTGDLKRKRLHNVVEEMAIASGVPMPEVYVLEQEQGINAFAAGHTPANAAIAVTQGALDRLNRDELQGVIAHEFSHVLNGDMRLNVQLMGWLFGLFVIALIGRTVVRFAPRSRKGGGGVVLFAFALIVLGYVGLFCGRLLQAAVSRNRERLADASGVQFTRNPGGLKGALVKIAGVPAGSKLAGDAEQVAHMLFAPGVRRLFATHPSLGERIRDLDPRFDVSQLRSAGAHALETIPAFGENPGIETVVSHAVPANPEQVAAQVGQVDTVHIDQAQALRIALPEALTTFAESSGKGFALVLALLLSRNDAVRERQLAHLASQVSAEIGAEVAAAAPFALGLDPRLRLPALLQIFPALRRLPMETRKALLKLAEDCIRADARVDMFEFCLAELLSTLLQDEMAARAPHGDLSLAAAAREIHVLFAALARCGTQDDERARRAYEAGMHRVLPRDRPAFAATPDWPVQLAASLRRLQKLHPYAKKAVIEGLVCTIAHDELLHVEEAELLRTVCAILHCPLPPLLGQPAQG